MHPALLLIPAAGMILLPRLWAREVLKRHNLEDGPFPASAGETAREMLDNHQLQDVRVELTDSGDHYDPRARAVRLARDKFDRKTLTALTTAAHEVAHALQHAEHYPPFAVRDRMVRVARITGQAGTVLLLSVPFVALVTRQALPTRILGTASLTMLGIGAAAQLSAVPTELDASFRRALPMLRQHYLDPEQSEQAKEILVACSATYLASSMIGVIHLWPWLGGGRFWLLPPARMCCADRTPTTAAPPRPATNRESSAGHTRSRTGIRGGNFERFVRRTAKPLVRQWLRRSDNARRNRKKPTRP